MSDRFPGSAGVSPATAFRQSAFLSKQSYVNNKIAVSEKLGRRDGGAPRERSQNTFAGRRVSGFIEPRQSSADRIPRTKFLIQTDDALSQEPGG